MMVPNAMLVCRLFATLFQVKIFDEWPNSYFLLDCLFFSFVSDFQRKGHLSKGHKKEKLTNHVTLHISKLDVTKLHKKRYEMNTVWL